MGVQFEAEGTGHPENALRIHSNPLEGRDRHLPSSQMRFPRTEWATASRRLWISPAASALPSRKAARVSPRLSLIADPRARTSMDGHNGLCPRLKQERPLNA